MIGMGYKWGLLRRLTTSFGGKNKAPWLSKRGVGVDVKASESFTSILVAM
jgi:hypothetical protein